jgi:hypothetical protein
MSKRASSENVYTFSDVALTVDDVAYNVSAIDITLGDNAIPSVNVSVDPAHALNEPVDTATNPSFDFITKISVQLQKAATLRLR